MTYIEATQQAQHEANERQEAVFVTRPRGKSDSRVVPASMYAFEGEIVEVRWPDGWVYRPR